MGLSFSPIQVVSILALGKTVRVFAPVGDETPAERIERHCTSLMIAPDYQRVLARRAVPSWRIVVDAAVAHVHAFENGVT
jgi:hypothetical protein